LFLLVFSELSGYPHYGLQFFCPNFSVPLSGPPCCRHSKPPQTPRNTSPNRTSPLLSARGSAILPIVPLFLIGFLDEVWRSFLLPQRVEPQIFLPTKTKKPPRVPFAFPLPPISPPARAIIFWIAGPSSRHLSHFNRFLFPKVEPWVRPLPHQAGLFPPSPLPRSQGFAQISPFRTVLSDFPDQILQVEVAFPFTHSFPFRVSAPLSLFLRLARFFQDFLLFFLPRTSCFLVPLTSLFSLRLPVLVSAYSTTPLNLVMPLLFPSAQGRRALSYLGSTR